MYLWPRGPRRVTRKTAKLLPFRLQALAVVAGRLAEVLGAVAAVARHALHGIGEVLGRYVQPFGIVAHITLRSPTYSSFASYESNVRMRPERQTELAKLE